MAMKSEGAKKNSSSKSFQTRPHLTYLYDYLKVIRYPIYEPCPNRAGQFKKLSGRASLVESNHQYDNFLLYNMGL